MIDGKAGSSKLEGERIDVQYRSVCTCAAKVRDHLTGMGGSGHPTAR